MADLKEPGQAELALRGALVAVVSVAVMVLGGWLLYGVVQVFSRSFQIGPVPPAPQPIAPPPIAPPPSVPPRSEDPASSPRP